MAYPGCLFGYPSNPSGGNNVDADSDSRSSSLLKRVIVTTHDPAATDGGPSRFPDVVDLATEAALPPIADGDIAYIALFVSAGFVSRATTAAPSEEREIERCPSPTDRE